MFRRLLDETRTLSIIIDGRSVETPAGDSVAAALLVAKVDAFRLTPRRGVARGPYCGMGVCFDCLVTIDGVPNRQACMVPVAAGMVVETGSRLPELAPREGA